MRAIIVLASLVLLILAACTVPPQSVNPAGYSPDSSALYGTAGAVAAQETAVAYQLTSTAGAAKAQATGTAVSSTQQAQAVASTTAEAFAAQTTATSESLSVQATQQAIYSQATYNAIAANATGTAVSQLAQAEQRLIADEAARLANQRQQEQVWTIVKVTVFTLIGLGGAIFLTMVGYRLYNLSRPVDVQDGNGRIITALPSGQYQIMPTRGPLALPEPQPIQKPGPIIELPSLAEGHVLIAGETRSGKSTAMRAVLQSRRNVVVLDPHYSPGNWPGARVIGGGRDFDAIGQYMQSMSSELNNRFHAMNKGQTQFDPLTVATDEMPAIIAALGRSIGAMWREWVREGWKVGLYFAVSTQSTRVTTLGIKGEGDLLENFAYVLVLGKLAINEYGDLARGMERPAILHTIDGARQVVIPHIPAGPSLPTITANQPPQQIVEIEGVLVSPAMIQQIVAMKREGASQRAIEQEVMGYQGGQAHAIVKAVLDEYCDVVNGRFPAI